MPGEDLDLKEHMAVIVRDGKIEEIVPQAECPVVEGCLLYTSIGSNIITLGTSDNYLIARLYRCLLYTSHFPT